MIMHLLLITLMYTPIEEKPKLIYIGDPMCSWCYGIAPELEGIQSEYKDLLEFELILGGLRPYNTQTMTDLKDFLTHHWEEVHQRSQQKFNYKILDDANITYDTEPPCRANMIVREMHPEKSFAFFHASQHAFYEENKNMHLAESYADILSTLEINEEKFNSAFASAEAKERIKEDFNKAQALGVNSFPTVVISHQDKMYIIAQGYATQEKMSERIRKILDK